MSHYKPYPAYKDSGVEWLGLVPEHWVACRFSRVIAGIKDGTHGTFERVDDGQPLLSAKNISDGALDISSSESQISEADHASIVVNGYPKRGDLLLTIVGSIGRACIYPYDYPLSFQRSVCFIRLTPGHSPNFFRYLSQSKFFQEQIQSKSKSSAQAGIYMGDVAATSIAFPVSIEEQHAIVNLLDRETARIDALIEKKTRFIELLREKRQALITHAVTKGLDPNVKMKDSGVEWLGEVPEHWMIRPFKVCIDFQEGPGVMAADFCNEGVPLLRVAGVQGRWASLEGCNYLESAKVDRQWSHFRLEHGDLLISASASMGTVCEVTNETVGAVAYTGLIRLRGKQDLMLRSYIRYLLASSVFSTQIEFFKAGSTIQHFGPTHLSQMFVVCPPLEEQEAISQLLEAEILRIDDLLAKSEHSIALLKERRSALITAAVTGQIDLREAV